MLLLTCFLIICCCSCVLLRWNCLELLLELFEATVVSVWGADCQVTAAAVTCRTGRTLVRRVAVTWRSLPLIFFFFLWNKCYSCFWRTTKEVAAAAGRTASILCRCYCSTDGCCVFVYCFCYCEEFVFAAAYDFFSPCFLNYIPIIRSTKHSNI